MPAPSGWQQPIDANVAHSSGISGLDLCAPTHSPRLHLPRSSSLSRQWPKMRTIARGAASHATAVAACCCDNAYFPISPSFYHQIVGTVPVGCGVEVLAHVGFQASNSYTIFGDQNGGYDFGLTATFGNVQRAGSFSLDAVPATVIANTPGLHLWRQVFGRASSTLTQTRTNFYWTGGEHWPAGANLLSSNFDPPYYWSPSEPPFDIQDNGHGAVLAPNTVTIGTVNGQSDPYTAQGYAYSYSFTDLGPYDPRASGTFELTTNITSPYGYASAWKGSAACNFSVEYVVGVIRC